MLDKVNQHIQNYFDFRSAEALPLALLLMHSFFKGMSFVFFETPANTLFLSEMNVRQMPYVYIATAIISTSIGFVYTYLESRMKPSSLLITVLSFLLISVFTLYLTLVFFRSEPVLMALMIWKDVVWILGGLEFWALAGLLFDLRQGKRLFALVGVGEVFSIVGAGLSVSWLVDQIGIANLLLLSCIGFIGSLVVLLRAVPLLQSQPQVFSSTTENLPNDEFTPKHQSLNLLLRDRYVLTMLIISVVSYLSYYLIDYLFYHQVESLFGHEERLATFFGIFYAVLGLLHLLIGSCAAGPLLKRFGVGFGLLALPVADGVGVFFLDGTTDFFAGIAIVVWITVAVKLIDEVLRLSIDGPSYRILYQPLPSGLQLRVQALRESIIEPIAIGFSGFVLLGLTTWLELSALEIANVLLVILLAWVGLSILMRKEYKSLVFKSFVNNSFTSGIKISEIDSGSIAPLRFNNQLTVNVVQDAGTSEAMAYADVAEIYRSLLIHHETTARTHVLNKLEIYGHRLSEMAPELRKFVLSESDSTLRPLALRALCACISHDELDELLPWLDSHDRPMRRAAIAGLMRHGGISGVLSAGNHFNQLVTSDSVDDRKDAAKILGDAGISSFFHPLRSLLSDVNYEVRFEALNAAGRLKPPQVLPEIIAAFSDPITQRAATHVLVRYGQDALPAIKDLYLQSFDNSETQKKLVKVAGEIGGPLAIEWQSTLLSEATRDIVICALPGLVSNNWSAKDASLNHVHDLIKLTIAEMAYLNGAMVDLEEDLVMVDSARCQLQILRDHIFWLLALIYPPETILKIKNVLSGKNAKIRSNAFEALDDILPSTITEPILALLDDFSPNELHAQIGVVYRAPLLGKIDRLIEIANNLECKPHFRSLALYRICKLIPLDSPYKPKVLDMLSRVRLDKHPITCETALWVERQFMST